ncbi:MAG TPA: hypothetical protein VI299_25300 [Polyangiales bacterium]
MRRLFLGLALLVTACGDDEDDADGFDGGALDAGANDDETLDAQTAAADGGSLDASPHTDASEQTLCAKYGGANGVERAIKQYVIEELATDCRIGLHFTSLPADRLARFGDCLAIQAQELFACPGVHYAGSSSPNGLRCRDMKSAHAGLGLSRGDFDALVSDLARGLAKAGIAQQDIAHVAPALLGLEDQVVESLVETPSRACEDAGSGDAGR